MYSGSVRTWSRTYSSTDFASTAPTTASTTIYAPYNSSETYISNDIAISTALDDVPSKYREFGEDLWEVFLDKRYVMARERICANLGNPISSYPRRHLYNHRRGRDHPWTGRNFCKQN